VLGRQIEYLKWTDGLDLSLHISADYWYPGGCHVGLATKQIKFNDKLE